MSNDLKKDNHTWKNKEVIIIDPCSTYISADCKIGKRTKIMPNVTIYKNVEIGEDVIIHSGSVIMENSTIDAKTVIMPHTTISESTIGSGCRIGPNAYIRNNSLIGNEVVIGAFVEITRTTIEEKTAARHLSFIANAKVGKNVNIGAGTITANFYKGEFNETIISDNASIGANTVLVAPVKVEEFASTAAGSTITKDIPKGKIAFARSRQENKETKNVKN